MMWDESLKRYSKYTSCLYPHSSCNNHGRVGHQMKSTTFKKPCHNLTCNLQSLWELLAECTGVKSFTKNTWRNQDIAKLTMQEKMDRSQLTSKSPMVMARGSISSEVHGRFQRSWSSPVSLSFSPKAEELYQQWVPQGSSSPACKCWLLMPQQISRLFQLLQLLHCCYTLVNRFNTVWSIT